MVIDYTCIPLDQIIDPSIQIDNSTPTQPDPVVESIPPTEADFNEETAAPAQTQAPEAGPEQPQSEPEHTDIDQTIEPESN